MKYDTRQYLEHYWYVAERINLTITVKEFAVLCNFSESYVRRLARVGRIKGLKSGNTWYLLPPDL